MYSFLNGLFVSTLLPIPTCILKFGALDTLHSSDLFSHLDSHPWPIELASQDLQGLRHPTMASLGAVACRNLANPTKKI